MLSHPSLINLLIELILKCLLCFEGQEYFFKLKGKRSKRVKWHLSCQFLRGHFVKEEIKPSLIVDKVSHLALLPLDSEVVLHLIFVLNSLVYRTVSPNRL